MIRVLGHHPEQGCRTDLAAAEVAVLLAQPEWKLWVDLEKPTPDETAILRDVFRFHPVAVEDCEAPRHHPKLDDYGDYLFLIVHGITPDSSHREFSTRELDLFLGPRYLVTYHRSKLRSIQAAVDALAKSGNLLGSGPDFVMHFILDNQVDRYMPVLDQFAKAIEQIEDRIFKGSGKELIDEILKIKRSLIRLRRISGHQREILQRLSLGRSPHIQAKCAVYLRDVYDDMVRVSDLAESYRELATSAQDAYVSSVSLRLNETMKVLTAFAAIFIPLTFVVGVYGMNFEHMPELSWRYGYLFIWIVMVAVGAGLFAFFRRKHLV